MQLYVKGVRSPVHSPSPRLCMLKNVGMIRVSGLVQVCLHPYEVYLKSVQCNQFYVTSISSVCNIVPDAQTWLLIYSPSCPRSLPSCKACNYIPPRQAATECCWSKHVWCSESGIQCHWAQFCRSSRILKLWRPSCLSSRYTPTYSVLHDRCHLL